MSEIPEEIMEVESVVSGDFNAIAPRHGPKHIGNPILYGGF